MLFENINSLVGGFLLVIDKLLIVRVTTKEGTEEACSSWEKLIIGIRHPPYNRRIVLLSLA